MKKITLEGSDNATNKLILRISSAKSDTKNSQKYHLEITDMTDIFSTKEVTLLMELANRGTLKKRCD